MTDAATPRVTCELGAEPIAHGTPEWHDFNAIWPFMGYATPERCDPGAPIGYVPVARGKSTFFPKDVHELVEQSEREIADLFRRDPWMMCGPPFGNKDDNEVAVTIVGVLSFSARVLALQPGRNEMWEVAKRFAYVAAWNRRKYNDGPGGQVVPDLRNGWSLVRDGCEIAARLE